MKKTLKKLQTFQIHGFSSHMFPVALGLGLYSCQSSGNHKEKNK
jgi:hypothetical protein